jgi:dTDP-4-amino-4,6-dideoxygalactose transaminase
MNGKMSEFHAIVGLHNLRRVDQLMAERQERARCYRQRVESATSFRVTAWPANVVHTFKDFTIRLNGGAERRDAIIGFLAGRGVETRAYFFPPVHEQAYFRQYADRPLPNTERLSRQVITLPFYTTMTHEEMDYVVDALKAAEEEIP